jgi:hypothetical protein
LFVPVLSALAVVRWGGGGKTGLSDFAGSSRSQPSGTIPATKSSKMIASRPFGTHLRAVLGATGGSLGPPVPTRPPGLRPKTLAGQRPRQWHAVPPLLSRKSKARTRAVANSARRRIEQANRRMKETVARGLQGPRPAPSERTSLPFARVGRVMECRVFQEVRSCHRERGKGGGL